MSRADTINKRGAGGQQRSAICCLFSCWSICLIYAVDLILCTYKPIVCCRILLPLLPLFPFSTPIHDYLLYLTLQTDYCRMVHAIFALLHLYNVYIFRPLQPVKPPPWNRTFLLTPPPLSIHKRGNPFFLTKKNFFSLSHIVIYISIPIPVCFWEAALSLSLHPSLTVVMSLL